MLGMSAFSARTEFSVTTGWNQGFWHTREGWLQTSKIPTSEESARFNFVRLQTCGGMTSRVKPVIRSQPFKRPHSLTNWRLKLSRSIEQKGLNSVPASKAVDENRGTVIQLLVASVLREKAEYICSQAMVD